MSADEFDFGFTAVTEEELGALVKPPTPPQPSVSPDILTALTAKISDLESAVGALKPASASGLSRIEEKMDRILSMELKELGDAVHSSTDGFAAMLDEVEERKVQMREECREKLQQVERLILPLLQNLMKNPEKPYILWANRSERISAQIDKITAVTRSYGV
jgi:DNA-binding transcriptional regulator YiaG